MLDDGDSCDPASFTDAASQVLTFSRHVLSVLASSLVWSTTVMHTCNVKAFDWDDVHIAPFIVGVDFLDDINNAVVAALPANYNYYIEGPFRSFPPDECGEILGTTLNKDGNLIDAVVNRSERIEQTMYQDRFIQGWDQRIAQPGMWDVRRTVLKAHFPLGYGGHV